MPTKKDKDKKGPSTQPTSTNGVNAVGTNHGTKQGYVAYSTYSPDAAPVPGKKFNVVGVPGATVPPAAFEGQQQQAQQQDRRVAYNNYKVGEKWYHEGVPGATIPPGYVYTIEQRKNADDGTEEGRFSGLADAFQQAQQAGPVQVQPQTDTNQQQILDAQPVRTTSAGSVVQSAPQQFVLPNQITMPSGRVINVQPQQQPVQQMGGMPQQVTIGNNTYQMPVQTDTNASAQQQKEPTAAERNAQYEAQKQQEAAQQQYNNAVDEYLKAGGNPNAIRTSSDPNIGRMQPTAEQVQQAQANAQKAASDEDEYQKTLKEYLDSKYESPEDREQREKREARQRRWAAISEGIANVFNVGGSIAGARPAQWKSTVGELYANQEAESDKRRLEYRQALKDLTDYRTAIRNGDIARARAIEDKRRNDIYEYRIMQEQEAKAAERKLKAEAQEKDQARKDQDAKNRQRKADDDHLKAKQQLEGTYKPSGNTKKSSSGGKGRGRSGGSRATGAAAARSANASRKRVTKNRLQNLKNKNK